MEVKQGRVLWMRPFSVKPSIGTLGVNETTQFTIDFYPEKSGNHCKDLVIHYDTGEDIHVNLYGAATDVNVRLDKNSLTIEKTYITLANQRSVVIHNRSDIIAHFQWKAFATHEKEKEKKQMMCQTLQAEQNNVLDQLLVECNMNPALREHLSIVTRTFENRRATVHEDVMLFNNKVFSIEPLVRNSAILSNQGAIDALFHLMWPSTVLGACFAFQPREGIVEPGGHQAIHISFSSTVLGPFSEEFKFHVNGSPQPVTLVIRGCVIGPTFHFSVPSLDFGDVSFGFPQTLSCCLSNTSLVPMTFSLHVPGDGNGDPSIRSQDQASDISRPMWRKAWFASAKPKEFTISPNYGTIRPQGFLDIEVTLCSNTVKTYETALVVDIKGSGEDVLALPISARCFTPPLHVASTTVNFGRCFLKFQYQQVAKLVNEADLPGCYGVLPQEYKNSPTILYSSPAPCGIIPPHATVEIPLALEVAEKGHQETMAYIAIFGNEDFPL
ncbi:Hydrocephalus-inducing protein, partial [Ophiophagus hannah]